MSTELSTAFIDKRKKKNDGVYTDEDACRRQRPSNSTVTIAIRKY